MHKLARGLHIHEAMKPAQPRTNSCHSNRDHVHTQETCDVSTIPTENNVVRDVTAKDHTVHDVTPKNYLINSISLKKSRNNPHFGRRVVKAQQTEIVKTPLDQLAMAGPLEEINKKLRNQSTFWMCLV